MPSTMTQPETEPLRPVNSSFGLLQQASFHESLSMSEDRSTSTTHEHTDSTGTPSAEALLVLPIDDLHESPFNPRRIFGDLEGLAADIKSHGRVLQPLLVRPRTTPLFGAEGHQGYEIVFGHRRYRAAQLAGLEQVHCMVRAMTDEESRRAQVSENLQREDVHPIEEAEGFQQLMRDDGLSADAIAEQFGKSKSHVYGRLKLLEACPTVREACLAGDIGSEVALLIARIRGTSVQEKALASLKSNNHNIEDGGKTSYRRIRDFLRERFTLDLRAAIFPIEDEGLLLDAGACTSCPKRSGNAPEFADLAGEHEGFWRGAPKNKGLPDLCTDPDCFDAKKRQHLKNEAAKLEAAGKTVVDGNKARQAVSATGQVKGDFVSAKDARALLKNAGVKPTQVDFITIQDPRTGKTHEAVKRETLAAAGVTLKVATLQHRHTADQAHAERKEREQRAKERTARRVQVLCQVLAAARAVPRSTADLRLIAKDALEKLMHHGWGVRTDAVCEALGYEDPDQITEKLEVMSADQLALLVLAITLTNDLQASTYADEGSEPELPEYLAAAAQAYGVEV